MRFALLVSAGALLDVLWTLLVIAVDRGWAVRAALAQLAFTLFATGAIVALAETRSVSDLVAYSCGGAAGTWLVVKYGRRP